MEARADPLEDSERSNLSQPNLRAYASICQFRDRRSRGTGLAEYS